MTTPESDESVEAAIRSLCGSNQALTGCGCGGCEYELLNGMYQRVGAGACTGSCTCPATITPIVADLLAGICPSVTFQGEILLTCCTMPLLEGEQEAKIIALFKALIAGYRFWKLMGIVLGLLSAVLLGVVIYLLSRG